MWLNSTKSLPKRDTCYRNQQSRCRTYQQDQQNRCSRVHNIDFCIVAFLLLSPELRKIDALAWIILTFSLCSQREPQMGASKRELPYGNPETGTSKREFPNENTQTGISKREHPNGNPQIGASKRELPNGNQSLRSYRTRSRAMPRRLYIYEITSWLCHGCELVCIHL